jgi:hypothetical protein
LKNKIKRQKIDHESHSDIANSFIDSSRDVQSRGENSLPRLQEKNSFVWIEILIYYYDNDNYFG